MNSKFSINQLNGWINNTIASFGIIVCIGLVLMTVLDVIMRRFFNEPMVFSFEVTQMALALIVFSFIPYATNHMRHVSIEVLVQVFPKSIQQWTNIIGDLLSAVLFLFICRQSFLKGMKVYLYNYMTGELEIPLYPFYYFIALGALLSCISLSLRAFSDIHNEIKRQK